MVGSVFGIIGGLAAIVGLIISGSLPSQLFRPNV